MMFSWIPRNVCTHFRGCPPTQSPSRHRWSGWRRTTALPLVAAAVAVMGLIPPWLAVLVISRDFIILLGISVMALMSIPFEIKPTVVSKFTTAFQLLTVFAVLVLTYLQGAERDGRVLFLFWVTGALTVISGLNYIMRGLRFVSQDEAQNEKK